MRVFANRNDLGYNDRLEYELQNVCKNQVVNISVAFFSNSHIILKLLEQGCIIKLLVRLNDGTSYDELRKIIGKDNIQIKFYTKETFHPKLYIVGDYSLYLGSANCTNAGLKTNTEISMRLDYEDNPDVFMELQEIFDDYWIHAQPLQSKDIDDFEKIMREKPGDYYGYSSNVIKAIGEFGYANVTQLSDNKKTKEEHEQEKLLQFIGDTKREYLSFVDAFRKLEKYYSSTPERRWKDAPLRIEIDRFLWWIGETQYKKDEWKINTLYHSEKIQALVDELKVQFLKDDNKWLVLNGVSNFYELNTGMGTPNKLNSLSEDDLFELLCNIYSFHDSSQYHGGIEDLKKDFFSQNTIKEIKQSLNYLLFGTDDYIERLYHCMKGKYRLKSFGPHSVKELYGYINTENNPTYNGRIQKSLSWLGFGIL